MNININLMPKQLKKIKVNKILSNAEEFLLMK